MRNAQLAEWILSLVTSSDRAASTVGDLMENSAIRGAFWFWIGVLRTAFSLLWKEFSGEPARMMGLAARGFLLQGVLILASVICIAFVAGVFWGVTGAPSKLPPEISPIVWALFGVVSWGLIPFQVGRWLARRSPERELAPCLAFIIFDLAVSGVLGLIWGSVQGSLLDFMLGLVTSVMLSILYATPLVAGAVWIRRKRITA
jgi:hypothetical protein